MDSSVTEKDPTFEDDISTEDLGIIDLEDDDVFDNIDDDKLPFLKNTYSKKNRPNNSKSVAAGSKSKANRIDFGREDVGPISTPRGKSDELIAEIVVKESSKLEEDLHVDDIDLTEETTQVAVSKMQDLKRLGDGHSQSDSPELLSDMPEEVEQESEGDAEEDAEGEDNIDNYLDFEDNEGDDEFEIQHPEENRPHPRKETKIEQTKKQDEKKIKDDELDVFDIVEERKITDEEEKFNFKKFKPPEDIPNDTNTPRKELIKKKLTPIKFKSKNQDISIKASFPASVSRNISKSKLNSKLKQSSASSFTYPKDVEPAEETTDLKQQPVISASGSSPVLDPEAIQVDLEDSKEEL